MSQDNASDKQAAADAVNGSKQKLVFALSQDAGEALEKSGYSPANPASPLLYAIQQASGTANKKAPRLAFTENPNANDNYLGLYKTKRRLLPDEIIKQIRINDHLVAAILRARSNMLSLFGHLRKDRFDVGVEISLKPEFEKILTPEQAQKVTERIKRFEQVFLSCGHTEGLEQQDRTTLADFLSTQVYNGLSFGRFATEVIYDRDSGTNSEGKLPFHRFRPVDVGTIYKTVRKGEAVGATLRQQAIQALQSIKGDKIDVDIQKFQEDGYAWLQIIDGTPRQAFTHDELLVYNLFPSIDVEQNGYPVSPMDTVINSITTHISIDTYKKLYFQNGRASRGMLVIKSDEVDQQVLNDIKLQFNASINSVSNSFRTPIFGMGKDDEVDWISMMSESPDSSFEYIYDQVARNILSAFGVSPDELPGYAHLSRGTNSQTLSESSNEFRLTAARDTGLRPLILKLQIFFNDKLFPIMDPLLSKICIIKLSGLDAANKEQESSRLAQDSALHMTYDGLLKEVDKEPVGKHMGGDMPFNERWQIIADKTLNMSEIKANLLGDPSALVDPMLQYKRDPFFLQFEQILMQANPATLKAYLAPRPYALDILKMNILDSLEDEECDD